MGRIIDITGQKFGRLTPVEKAGRDSRGEIIWRCLCDCGNYTEALSSNIRSGKTSSCGCLQKEKASGFTGRHKDLTNQHFGRLQALYATDKRLNGQVVWRCKCDCGNEIDVRSWNLTSGKTISCGCSRSITARKINGKKLLGQRFGKLLVVEELPFEPDKSGNVYWRCKCDCGNETILYTSLLTQGISSCGCLNISRGELKIGELLGKAGISFEREKTFETCYLPNSSRPLRFDFYVNNSYVIEFDGIQHFQADTGWATQEVHERVAAHDEYKNNWCKENNIPIIRIPYTHLKNLTIEDLLLDSSTYILK